VQQFDIVTVPDFSGPKSHFFAARTLLFLASWLEHAGPAAGFPLHIACIGEPPPVVRKMAERAGALVSVHTPLTIDERGACNKLRGLEVEAKTGQLLLLDTDMLIFGSLLDLLPWLGKLGAAPNALPRISNTYWEKIYNGLGLPPPAERIMSGAYEAKWMPQRQWLYPQQALEAPAMFPYYSGGLVWVPDADRFRRSWETFVVKIAAQFPKDDPFWPALGRTDQAGLAVALGQLQRDGLEFKAIDKKFHVLRFHLFRQSVPFHDIRIFHAKRILRGITDVQQMSHSLDQYQGGLWRSTWQSWSGNIRNQIKVPQQRSRVLPSLLDSLRLGWALQGAYRRQVAGLLGQ
jgi:hypothetical protein